MKELKDTVKYMISMSYKNRFIAEYQQVKIRYNKLKSMCKKWDAGVLDFTPTCSRTIYDSQLKCMKEYLDILERRAKMEDIDLSEIENVIDFKDIVDKALDKYKNMELDWWSWDDFKSYLKREIESKYSKVIDLRTQEGRDILHYARNKWENEEW